MLQPGNQPGDKFFCFTDANLQAAATTPAAKSSPAAATATARALETADANGATTGSGGGGSGSGGGGGSSSSSGSLSSPSLSRLDEMATRILAGLERVVHFGWFDLDSFDPDEYEHYERVENGDFNWIVPGFFLSFSGPTQTPIAYVDGVKTNTPETYFDYYRKNGITGIIRFNNKVYDRKKFLDAGFNHYDMYALPTARLGHAPNPT